MNPRWRRFLLLLTFIGCALLHAPRLHQMQAKPVAQPAPSVALAATPALPRPLISKWTLASWTFDATPLALLDDQPLSFFLMKESIKPPSSADVEATSQDVAFFADTELALEPCDQREVPRTIGRLPARPSANVLVLQPRRVRHNGRGINYVKPAIWNPEPFGFAAWSSEVPVRASDHSIVRTPQTIDDDGSSVGETPDPTPVAGTPTPTPEPGNTGNEGGVIDPPDTGGFGGVGGVGGLPAPGGAIPEPALLAPILFIAMLLRRPKQCH
jgi:hypothetical protein